MHLKKGKVPTPKLVRWLLIASTLISFTTFAITPAAVAVSGCPSVDRGPGWVTRENAKLGTLHWDSTPPPKYSGTVAGWFDKVSAQCGENVGLHLSGNDRPVVVKIFRMGYYNGDYSRLVYTTTTEIVAKGSSPIKTPKTNTIYTTWPVSLNIVIDSRFPTGIYMAQFDDGSKVSYAPLVVKDNQPMSPLLLVVSTFTWQAYNIWGGWNLYYSPKKNVYDPARIVSFNRPYDRDGKSNFAINEKGIVMAAESAGLDVSYVTDNDIDRKEINVSSVKALIFGGHSEYWSIQMQKTALEARDLGINLLFLGGNQAYWRTRLEDNGRKMAVWKSDLADPYKEVPSMITNKWGAKPNPLNQSTLLGALFAGFGVTTDYKFKDGNAWPISGSGLKTGDKIVGVVGNEVDTIDRGAAPGVQTFLTSQATLKNITYDIALTYYVAKSKSGVLDVSTNGWVCSITRNCSWVATTEATSHYVKTITQNLMLDTYGQAGGQPAVSSVAPLVLK